MNTPLPDLIKLRDAIRLELDATTASSPQRPRLYRDAPSPRALTNHEKEKQREKTQSH
jgi:hypothetical protein